jgi:hypothetical protein
VEGGEWADAIRFSLFYELIDVLDSCEELRAESSMLGANYARGAGS